MKVSARNVFKGIIKSVEMGAVNVEIVIEVAPGFQISSIVTRKSFESLGLKIGKEAYAVIKASSVMVGVD